MDEILGLEKFVTNCDKGLLQIATGALLQLRQVSLEIATGITNCDSYYKLRRYCKLRQYTVSSCAWFYDDRLC